MGVMRVLSSAAALPLSAPSPMSSPRRHRQRQPVGDRILRHMAGQAIATIPRISHLAEIVYAVAEAVDDITTPPPASGSFEASRFSPVWILWIMSLRLMLCSASPSTGATGLRPLSVALGLCRSRIAPRCSPGCCRETQPAVADEAFVVVDGHAPLLGGIRYGGACRHVEEVLDRLPADPYGAGRIFVGSRNGVASPAFQADYIGAGHPCGIVASNTTV